MVLISDCSNLHADIPDPVDFMKCKSASLSEARASIHGLTVLSTFSDYQKHSVAIELKVTKPKGKYVYEMKGKTVQV